MGSGPEPRMQLHHSWRAWRVAAIGARASDRRAQALLAPAGVRDQVGAGEQRAERVLAAPVHAAGGELALERGERLGEARPLLRQAAQDAAPDDGEAARIEVG